MGIHTFVAEEVANKIDIRDQFNKLSQTVFGEDSPYIRAKESMLEYFNNSSISEREKAELMTKFATDMAVNTTNKLLDSALAIETSNRNAPYELAKVKADVLATYTNTDRVEQARLNDVKLSTKIDADIDGVKASIYKTVADTYSKTGYTTGIFNTYTNTATRNEDAVDLESVRGLQAKTYSTLAASFNNDGKFTIVPGTDSRYDFEYVREDVSWTNSATKANRDLVIRQTKGFDDNTAMKVYEAQVNSWGLMFSSGALDTTADKPSFVTNTVVEGLQTNLLTQTNYL